MHIYKITNNYNNKVYIGQTIQKNPMMRWYAHLSYAKRNVVSHLYNSIRKYGEDCFTWTIIDSANTVEELNLKEQYWLKHFQSITEVYNSREAGGNRNHSAESIEKKMKLAQKIRHATTDVRGWKRRDGGAMKGKSHPKKGKPSTKWSDESKEKYKLVAIAREERKRIAKEDTE